MSGSWQHFLPATYLAGFSSQRRIPARESLLWVNRRGARSVWETKAERVGAARDLYTLSAEFCAASGFDPDHIDATWSQVEGRLADGINEAIGERSSRVTGMSADLWAHVLVPFAAQVFVRGVEFGWRVENRAKTVGAPPASREQMNAARLLDMLWLAGAVGRAAWTIMHAPPGHFLITNDAARIPLRDPEAPASLRGWGIPLRRDALLMLVADRSNGARIWSTEHDDWAVGPIRHVLLDEVGVRTFNAAVARDAHKEIYGASKEAIDALRSEMTGAPPPELWLEPNWLVATPEECYSAKRSYERLTKALSVPPSCLLALTGGFSALPVFGGEQEQPPRIPLTASRVYAGRLSGSPFPVLTTSHFGGNERVHLGRDRLATLGLRQRPSAEIARHIGLKCEGSAIEIHWWSHHQH